MRPLDFLSMAAISFFTAYGLWQIAIRQPDRVQVRIVDLPPVTEAALLTSGIDRQTTTEFMEVRTALGRIKPAMTQISSQKQTRERNDGHSRAPKIGQWVKVEISTYSRSYHGNGTHGGERYDHYRGHTAATTIIGRRWVLPRGSAWEVEYLGKTITVRINDTGSWRPRKAPYWLDLSGAAWRDLTGIAPSRKVARMRRVR